MLSGLGKAKENSDRRGSELNLLGNGKQLYWLGGGIDVDGNSERFGSTTGSMGHEPNCTSFIQDRSAPIRYLI